MRPPAEKTGFRLALQLMAGIAVALLFVAFIVNWERPPVDSVQRGYRGTGIELVANPRTLAANAALHEAPAPLPAVSAEGPRAGDVYQNVQVLGDLSVAEFTRLMTAITQWVSPEQGCQYCHAGANFAADDVYTKVVSRRMLQMTQHINANWQDHVGQTGVTCYSCHRGQNVPANIWFEQPTRGMTAGMLGNSAGQNHPSEAAALASLPYDPFTPFLEGDDPIRVVGTTALPEGNRRSIKQTEWTYSLMMHMSESLGVNCTYCHNTRSFISWQQSAPPRVSAWYGIRMARNLNDEYLEPLQPVYPPHRLGPLGDAPKANCATCHQGAYKPLLGVSMLADYPSLAAVSASTSGEAGAAGGQPTTPATTSPPPAATNQPPADGSTSQ